MIELGALLKRPCLNPHKNSLMEVLLLLHDPNSGATYLYGIILAVEVGKGDCHMRCFLPSVQWVKPQEVHWQQETAGYQEKRMHSSLLQGKKDGLSLHCISCSCFRRVS